MQRLGDILVADGVLARNTLEALMPHVNGPMGSWLRAHGLVGAQALARAVAKQHGLPYLTLDSAQMDATVFDARDVGLYRTHRYLPLRRTLESMNIACVNPSAQLHAMLVARYDCPVKLTVISLRDFQRCVLQRHATAASRMARLHLHRRFPNLCAARTLFRHQALGLIAVCVVVAGALLWNMQASWPILLAACNLFYLLSLAFKLQLYSQGRIAARQQALLDKTLTQRIPMLDEASLPVYSILVPLYRETPHVMQHLIHHLNALDYPKEKLDIKLICEDDDTETIAALEALHPPETMEILRVPPSHPRTKPKACNVALQDIRGEFLVIFDAEDAPAPDQLKRAATMFASEPADVACLQAPLNYENRDENLLTQLFALEYSMLFRLLLPAMERMALPMPLGGTSNHLRVSALMDAGGWDAFNVTEDADLGIRLSYFGYRVRMLPSLTKEEAPVTLGSWMRQRTRWIKGYIQTWLVYMRAPAELKRRLGPRAYYGFQFFVGAPALTFLLAPILWAVFIVAPLGLLPTGLSPFMLSLCMISFVGGIASHWLFARAVLKLEGWKGMGIAMAVFPFYWLLHSVACARALWQLVRAPHYWEKTTHGISTLYRRA